MSHNNRDLPERLPNAEQAVVAETKVTGYLLLPKGKGHFFSRFGFTVNQWQQLAEALRRHALEYPVSQIERGSYGIRYIIEGVLQTPDNRNPIVRSVWQID